MIKLLILYLGIAGFLGSNLIKRLISNGKFVYCIDNLSTGYTLNRQNSLIIRDLILLIMISENH